MRIVITGASGNIGTALLRTLVNDESFAGDELIGIVRRPPEPEDVYARVTWHALDLADSDAANLLVPIFEGADVVVHTAWGFQPTRRPDYLHAVGVEGTRAVARAVAEAGVRQLIHLSSVGVYAPGRAGVEVDESWPATGVETSPYSHHKVMAEAILDDLAATSATTISRLRPGFVLQARSASELLRYGTPAVLPRFVFGAMPILPLDRRFAIPVVHADDVAQAIALLLRNPVEGAFNLAADEGLDRDTIARVMGVRPVQVSTRVLGAAVRASWRLHLQPLEPGWFDLACTVPLLDNSKARRELNWQPKYRAAKVLADLRRGFREQASMPSPPLRRRTVPDNLRQAFRRGPVSRRRTA